MEKFRKNYIREWSIHCIKPKKVIEAMQQELTYYKANQKLKRQVQESEKTCSRPTY